MFLQRQGCQAYNLKQVEKLVVNWLPNGTAKEWKWKESMEQDERPDFDEASCVGCWPLPKGDRLCNCSYSVQKPLTFGLLYFGDTGGKIQSEL